MNINALSQRVIGAAIEVHKALGPGLLESAYARALSAEFEDCGIAFQREVSLNMQYRGRVIDGVYRLDFLFENLIVLKLKALDAIHPVHKAQLATYLRVADKNLGRLLNFGGMKLKDNMARVVWYPDERDSIRAEDLPLP